jgi:hypothetical protein
MKGDYEKQPVSFQVDFHVRQPGGLQVIWPGIEPATPGLGNSSGTIPSDPSENPDSSTGCNQKKN